MKKSFFGLIILFIFLTTYTPKFNFIIGSDFSIQTIEIEGNSILNSDEIIGSTDAVETFNLAISALDRANVSLTIDASPDPAMLNDPVAKAGHHLRDQAASVAGLCR